MYRSRCTSKILDCVLFLQQNYMLNTWIRIEQKYKKCTWYMNVTSVVMEVYLVPVDVNKHFCISTPNPSSITLDFQNSCKSRKELE